MMTLTERELNKFDQSSTNYESKFSSFLNHGLDIVSEYDLELKLKRSQRKLNKIKNPDSEVQKWVPIKEDVTDMSLRHL